MKKIFLPIVVLIQFFIASCIEDSINNYSSINLDTSSKLLNYFESNGDYINSLSNPALVSVEELHANSSNYHLIDIRPASEYSSGRIRNSVNIQAKDLLNYIKSLNQEEYQKIIIISNSGQHAAYCTSILRLLNYPKVFSLDFGLALWNSKLGSAWFDVMSHQYYSVYRPAPFMDNISYILPTLEDIEIDISDFVYSRAQKLLEYNFIENNNGDEETEVSIHHTKFDSTYIVYDDFGNIHWKSEEFIACIGTLDVSYLRHLPFTKFIKFRTIFDSHLRSSEHLQKIAPNKTVLLYSVNGQISAYTTAYLQMLGYNAKSIVFGMHQFNYSGISNVKNLESQIFRYEKVKEYEFIN